VRATHVGRTHGGLTGDARLHMDEIRPEACGWVASGSAAAVGVGQESCGAFHGGLQVDSLAGLTRHEKTKPGTKR
jgi:hypothetical protein